MTKKEIEIWLLRDLLEDIKKFESETNIKYALSKYDAMIKELENEE